jgi:hypothetical protein
VVDLADEEDHPVFEEHFLEGHLAVAVVAAARRPGIPTGIGDGRAERGRASRAASPPGAVERSPLTYSAGCGRWPARSAFFRSKSAIISSFSGTGARDGQSCGY